MEQINNTSKIFTGEMKKFRCHYINDNDRAVSRVLTLERLNHPALTAANVTAWGERFDDGVNRFDFLAVYIQLTDTICYKPNTTVTECPAIELIDGTIDYPSEESREIFHEVNINNVNRFFEHVAALPVRMMAGEFYPNMAVINAYQAAGMSQEADRLSATRARIIADREAEEKKRREAAEERERKEKEAEAAEIARQIAEEEEILRTSGEISGWGVVQLCDREGISIHLRTRHNLLEVVNKFVNHGNSINYKLIQGKRAPRLDGCFETLDRLKEKLGINAA